MASATPNSASPSLAVAEVFSAGPLSLMSCGECGEHHKAFNSSADALAEARERALVLDEAHSNQGYDGFRVPEKERWSLRGG